MPTGGAGQGGAWSAHKRNSSEAAGRAPVRTGRAHLGGRPADSGADARSHQNPSVDEGPRGLRAEIKEYTVPRDERGRDEGRSQSESRTVHPVTPRPPFSVRFSRLGLVMR